MSDQEKKSGSSGTGNTPVVVVSQTSENRQKQPYRSTELQEEATELHHKRSRAPGVPSVVEELKDVSEDSNGSSIGDNKDWKESERALAQDALKQKQSLAHKLSSSAKKFNKSEIIDYETITLAPLHVEAKTDPAALIPKPPLDAAKPSNVTEKLDEKLDDKKAEEDSITDEVAELRTPDAGKKQLEWGKTICSTYDLERKASVGPCYRPRTPFERPSGITICLPKKSIRDIPEHTGININIPRKYVPRHTLTFEMQDRRHPRKDNV